MQKILFALILVPPLLVLHGLAHAGPVTAPPTIALTAEIAGPPRQIEITVQDIDPGLTSITVDIAMNATVAVPSFTPGTTSPVVVTATEIDQTSVAEVALTATDIAGNTSNGSFQIGGAVSVPEPSTAANLGAFLAALAVGAATCSRYRSRRNQPRKAT